MKLVSVFHMGAYDTFSFAFRKGEEPTNLEELEGKTILLGSRRLAVDRDPMLAAAASTSEGQICRGRLADLGHRR